VTVGLLNLPTGRLTGFLIIDPAHKGLLADDTRQDLFHIHSRLVELLATQEQFYHVLTGYLLVILENVLERDVCRYHVHCKHLQGVDGAVMEIGQGVWVVVGVRLLLQKARLIGSLYLCVDLATRGTINEIN
jgi:hypothetical protein